MATAKKKVKTKAKKKVEKSEPEKQVERRSYGKGEVTSEEVIGLFSDEIQESFAVFGNEIDRENAKDRATTLLRAVRYGGETIKIVENEQKVPLCKRHRED